MGLSGNGRTPKTNAISVENRMMHEWNSELPQCLATNHWVSMLYHICFFICQITFYSVVYVISLLDVSFLCHNSMHSDMLCLVFYFTSYVYIYIYIYIYINIHIYIHKYTHVLRSGDLKNLWKMAVEIVDFPIHSMVIFHSSVSHYQRVHFVSQSFHMSFG